MDDSISISSPSVSPSQPQTQAQAMDSTISAILDDPNDAAAAASSLFDWSDFLDFNLDETFDAFHFAGADQNQLQNHQREANPTSLPYDSEPLLTPPDDPRRVRKRDPRLVCSNFLAGRVPCACPELDEKLELEEVAVLGGPGKKRARTVRISAGSNARCQVPGCEADISELKGYHKRHRVCLRCANASSVVFDGQSKRYCQQCGKFHVLPDFDEGKRSCRRKLERHNKRRRRPNNVKGIVEKEHQPMALAEDVSDDDDIGKDVTCLSSEVVEKEALLESNGQLSNSYSHGSQDIQNSSHVTFANSGETQIDGERENPISRHSPSYFDNKTSFSSLCPTGRISFKLYDWNPAEFPRRLRHQIFQWLASMPVELEGYIRPGCTILTVFIAMPRFMWVKLSEEPVLSLRDLVSSPGNLLSERDTFFVYLDDMIFHMIKDGNSAIKLKVNDLAPKLHYVSPAFFEAGKPMEFVACGSNLLQPKLRFLISFSGKYLPLDVYVSSPCGNTEGDVSALNCQLLKISVPQTEPNLFGPAFVEVENESGLSNFIPVLIGDKEICREMKIMQQRFDASSCCKGSQLSPASSSLAVSVLTQTEFSQFIMDVAWSLKKPVLETMQMLTSAQIRRFNNLLNFLTQNESTVILDRVLYYVNALTDNNFFAADIAPTDMELFRTNFDKARDVLYQKLQGKGHSVNYPRKAVLGECSLHRSSLNHIPSVEAFNHQDMKIIDEPKLEARVSLPSVEGGTTVPFLKGEVVMSLTVGERPTKSCSPLMTKTFFRSRTLVFIVAAATVCLGLCAVLLHPEKAAKVATTIRKCLLEDP